MKIKKSTKKIEYLLGIILSIFVFIIYLTTLAPTVTFIDSGELAAVAAKLGIAHPTGYPLFTLLGWIFTNLPLSFSKIYKLNLMSAAFCSVGVFFFFRLIVLLLEEFKFDQKIKKSGENIFSDKLSLFLIYVPAISASLILAFSQTYWSQAVSIEVYSLHILLIIIVLYLFFRAIQFYKQPATISEGVLKINQYWIIFAMLVGMSFTNHMTTILLAPGLLYLFFAVNGFRRTTFRFLLYLILPFIVGLSIYLYFPIRASNLPILNWGNPVDLEKIFWHISGKQYRVWIFSSTESAVKQFNYFISRLPEEFNYIFLIIALTGIIILFINNKKIFFFTILLFVGCIGYSINYDIHDIDSYFLLAFITIAIWFAFGFKWVVAKLSKQRSLQYIGVALMLISLLPLYQNYNNCNESDNYLVEDYTKNMFQSIETNGIIISYQWDYFLSASYYYQFVENYRSDIVVIDKELLRRSWYFKQLENQNPELIKKSKPEIDLFMIELSKFEHGFPYTYELIEKRFSDVIRSFIEKNIDERPLYVTGEIEPQYLVGFDKIPSGLCYRLAKNQQKYNIKINDFNIRKIGKKNRNIGMLMNLYTKAFLVNGIYYAQKGEFQKSLEFFNKGLEISPNSIELKNYRDRLVELNK